VVVCAGRAVPGRPPSERVPVSVVTFGKPSIVGFVPSGLTVIRSAVMPLRGLPA